MFYKKLAKQIAGLLIPALLTTQAAAGDTHESKLCSAEINQSWQNFNKSLQARKCRAVAIKHANQDPAKIMGYFAACATMGNIVRDTDLIPFIITDIVSTYPRRSEKIKQDSNYILTLQSRPQEDADDLLRISGIFKHGVLDYNSLKAWTVSYASAQNDSSNSAYAGSAYGNFCIKLK